MTMSLLFCSILNARGKRKRSTKRHSRCFSVCSPYFPGDRCTKRHSRCTKRHSRQGRASKAPRISDESKQLFSDQNITCELSSCGPEECDLTDCKPEVEEPQSKQGTSDGLKTARDLILEMFAYRPEKLDLIDSEQEVEEKDVEKPDSKKTPVWERVWPTWVNSDATYQEDDCTERQTYGIGMKQSRIDKNVLGPYAASRYEELKAAALLDAVRFMEECLKPTTSCCFEKEPYNLFVQSCHMFECDLSEAEHQLVTGHPDLDSICLLLEDAFGFCW